jgi:hypothetical protein
MNCKQIHELLLTNHLDNEMDAETQAVLRQHLESCQDCRRFEQEVRASTDAAFKDASEIQPPDSVWQNISRALDEETAAQYQQKPERFDIAGWLKDRLCGFSVFPRPAYALVTVLTVVITFIIIGHLSSSRDTVALEGYIDEQVEFIFGQDAEWDQSGADLNFEGILS